MHIPAQTGQFARTSSNQDFFFAAPRQHGGLRLNGVDGWSRYSLREVAAHKIYCTLPAHLPAFLLGVASLVSISFEVKFFPCSSSLVYTRRLCTIVHLHAIEFSPSRTLVLLALSMFQRFPQEYDDIICSHRFR